ncbi:unnamed protein product [Prunus brigantina]
MATAPSSLHQDFLCPKYPRLYHNSQFRTPRLRRRPTGTARPPSRFPSFAIRASSVVTLPPEWKSSTEESESSGVELLACPVCYEPLIRKGPPGLNLQAIYRSAFKCKKCDKSYSSKDIYLDLTVIAGLKEYVEVKPVGTELFRSPLVSFLYERGWRQNFNSSGFPGLDEEFKMAQDYFKSAEGGVLLDVSCGSGLFSRKFAKSGTYSGVVALDFSENMLRQCYDFLKKDPTLLATNLALVRADVSRLPFPSGSVGAVHAGAALHCWPSPSNAGIQKPAWLEALYTQKFFAGCSYHETAKKNEKNICCLDCCISICPHCLPSHRFHRLLQIRRYVYHDVVRLEDLQKLIDCSNVQAYTINSAKVVFIKKRPQNRQFKGSGNNCTSCDRSLQEPYIHCSLGCKVDYLLKLNKDLSPFLKKCNSLQLSPDFLVPLSDTGDEEMTSDQTNPHSTIVDCDDPMSSSSSGSSGSENMSMSMNMGYRHHEIVRKKRSGLNYASLCGRSAHKVSDEDMASNMISRRKRIPHRSPLC